MQLPIPPPDLTPLPSPGRYRARSSSPPADAATVAAADAAAAARADGVPFPWRRVLRPLAPLVAAAIAVPCLVLGWHCEATYTKFNRYRGTALTFSSLMKRLVSLHFRERKIQKGVHTIYWIFLTTTIRARTDVVAHLCHSPHHGTLHGQLEAAGIGRLHFSECNCHTQVETPECLPSEVVWQCVTDCVRAVSVAARGSRLHIPAGDASWLTL